MFLKKFKKSFMLLLILIPFPVFAYSEYLIPGGENVGIEIKSDGILVVGIYEVNNTYPAVDSGIKIGDIITKINNKKVESISQLITSINEKDSDKVKITYERNKESKESILNLNKVNGVIKTGLYVKDSITGIGTLSFIDPNTKIFGALGHEIIESNTGIMLDIKEGKIFESNVTNIERSENGSPGSKTADLKVENETGNIIENTNKGIFGSYTSQLPNKKKYKVAQPSEIKKGEAKILTVLEGNEIKEYNINILKINNNDTKNILFEITDQNLINKTGGIIQGMSGSPIIQDNYIIGSVTHVLIDNPIKGYGIFITKMLEEAEN